MSSLRILLIIVALFVYIKGFSQQQQDLETDRPDQTEAASVVPFKSIQLETGLYFMKDKAGTTTLMYKAYPTALLRFGVLNWLELRAEGTYQKLTIKDDVTLEDKGFGPLTLGTKVKLWKEGGLRPQAAFMAMVDLPVGDKAFKPVNPEVGLRLMFKNSLSERTDLNYNLAYGWENGEPVKGYALSIGTSITEQLTVFGEVFGEQQKGFKAAHSADGGVLFLIMPHLQLDVAAGIALNKQAPDYFITTGLSIRLPR